MIRLIASDIDGTLLPYDETVMPQRLFPLIRRLRERNILFCPASGRQYHSMRTLFAPVADEMCFLCENGAVLEKFYHEHGGTLITECKQGVNHHPHGPRDIKTAASILEKWA